MKKVLSLILTLFLILSISACGSSNSPANTSGSANSSNSSDRPARSNRSDDTSASPSTDSTAEASERPVRNTDSAATPDGPATTQSTPSGTPDSPATTQSPDRGNTSNTPDRSVASNLSISEVYENYTLMKSDAYRDISSAISEQSELALTVGLLLFPIVMVDLSLIPMSLIGIEGGAETLTMLGMGNVEFEQRGNTHIITYSSSDGEVMTQTCEYDASSDSLKTVLSTQDGAQESLMLEYVRSGDGYVSQYYMFDEYSGEYSLYKMYFNSNRDMTIGIEASSAGAPDSIYKKTGLTADFALNDTQYIKYENGVLTVLNDGETKTY